MKQKTHLNEKDLHYLRVKGWKKLSQVNGSEKQAGLAILISNKIDFQPKVIFVKGKIHQEKVSIMNIYDPNVRSPTFIKELY